MFIKKTLVKKRLWHRCFPVNFVKFLRTPFLQNTSGRLLLFQSRWLKTFVCRETSSNCKWVKYFNQLLCSIFMIYDKTISGLLHSIINGLFYKRQLQSMSFNRTLQKVLYQVLQSTQELQIQKNSLQAGLLVLVK